MSPYRERYHRELEELKMDAERLVEEVDMAVAKSVDALREYDVEKAREVIRDDQVINDLNLRIEKRCMQLLALQQPMAKDLRLIVTTLKIGVDLERIGDLAVDISRIVVHSRNKVHVKSLKNIPRMAEISREMLVQANRAFKENDSNLARETTK